MQTDASRPRQDSSTVALSDWSDVVVAAEMERSAVIEIEFMTISLITGKNAGRGHA
jgi:hypothetical protein